jgi:hypothetical protein
MRIENLPELPPGEWSHCEYRAAKPGEFALLQEKEELNWKQWEHQATSILGWVVLVPAKKYREPVLPADWAKECEFSNDKKTWTKGNLAGYLLPQTGDVVSMHWWYGRFEREDGAHYSAQYKFARIEVSE